jgi:hypothetical protein
LFKTAVDVAKLWFALVVRRDHVRRDGRPISAGAVPPEPGDRA